MTPAIALIVTGRLEEMALGRALERLFPGARFAAERSGDGFTSNRVRLPLPARTTNADKLARRMIAAVDPGRGAQPADYAFVVEDLELGNQPETAAQPRQVGRYKTCHPASQVE